jgi:hypothetical protein
MAIHKLDLGDFDEIDYSLIAIYTALDDYRLAYYINQKFNVNLRKSKTEIQITGKNGEVYFSRFHYYENKKEISWDLIQNKNEVIQKQKKESLDLFSNISMDFSSKMYMLPEFKKVDYFLKIENGVADLNILKIQHTLNTIDNITTMYIVDTNKLKSKNNLIF